MANNPKMRWMISRDFPEVLTIEAHAFPPAHAFTMESLRRTLSQRHTFGTVVDYQDQVIGYSVYTLRPRSITLLSLATHPEFYLRGVGHSLIERLTDKLTPDKRSVIACWVPETWLRAQLFFRAEGFLAVRSAREMFDGEDGIRFEFRDPDHPVSVSSESESEEVEF